MAIAELPPSVMVAKDGERSGQRLRLLCLHGFRTSGEILKTQLGKWGSSIHDLLDLTYLDAPFPSSGKSEVEGLFPPPFYEWYLFKSDLTVFKGLEESIKYVSDYMKEHGPFDGFLGFSQGAILAAYLTYLQEKGLALSDIDPVHLLVVVGGAKLKLPQMPSVFEGVTQCSSIHFLDDGATSQVVEYMLQIINQKLKERVEEDQILI